VVSRPVGYLAGVGPPSFQTHEQLSSSGLTAADGGGNSAKDLSRPHVIDLFASLPAARRPRCSTWAFKSRPWRFPKSGRTRCDKIWRDSNYCHRHPHFSLPSSSAASSFQNHCEIVVANGAMWKSRHPVPYVLLDAPCSVTGYGQRTTGHVMEGRGVIAGIDSDVERLVAVRARPFITTRWPARLCRLQLAQARK
jgi:hypothetical protein